MKRIAKIIVGIMVVVLALLVFKTAFVFEFPEFEDGFYLLQKQREEGLTTYSVVQVDGDDIYMINYDENCMAAGKMNMREKYTIWHHFLGNIYFMNRNIFSLRIIPDGAIPVTMSLEPLKYYYFNNYVNYDENDEGSAFDVKIINADDVIDSYTTAKSVSLFHHDYISISGETYERMDDDDERLNVAIELIRLFIDPVIEEDTSE